MAGSPLDAHAATPHELRQRIAAERRGAPFLLYRGGADEQVIVDLTAAADRVVIGRRRTNDIPLEWDSEVSRSHAALERLDADWLVEDDGLSRNGTYVNGERVTTRRRLLDGDVIRIGGTSLAYCAPAGESSAGPTVTARGPRVGERLSPAQQRVLVALCRPFKEETYATPATNQQIAEELVLSVETVKSTLRALFATFGIDHLPQNEKRASLAVQALRSGVVTRREL